MTEPETRGNRPMLDESLSLLALDLIPDPVLVWEVEEGPEFRCVAANRAALEISGFDKGQLVGKRLEDIKSADQAAISRRQFEAAMEGTRSSVERTFDVPTGTVSLRVTTTAIRDDEGRCTHIFTVASDSTSERQAEIARRGHLEADQARRQAEQELAASFENAPVAMSITAPDGKMLRVNPAMCDMLDRSSDELLTMTWREFTHPDDIEADQREVDRLLEDASPGLHQSRTTVEKRYIRADGSVIWISLSMALVRDGAGDPVHFVAHMQDITARKRTEMALAEAEERFRSAFDHAPIGVALVDLDGRIFRCNMSLSRMLGYTQEELCARTVPDITHPDDVAASTDARRAAIAGEHDAWQLEKRYIASDGRVVHAVLNGTVVRDADGSPLYIIGQVVDLTSVHQANERLRVLLQSRDDLIASVSHELRTPLTGVIGFAELLSNPDSEISPSDRQEMIQSIARQGADLANIIEDLLTAAKVQTNDLSVASLPVDLHAEAEHVLGALDPGSSASIELEGQPALATADPGRVRQILRNLISNAVRYGGDVVRVVVGSTDSRALVEVRDNGSGVAPHKRDAIFEPYGRAHAESGLTSSVGLGLSISRTLARLMGGELTYNREGGETTFRLTLPAATLTPNGLRRANPPHA